MAMNAVIRDLTPYAGQICGAIAREAGDDAAQETLIAVMRALPGLRDPAALHGWVRRIAIREAVRVARRHDREVPTEDLPVKEEFLPDVDLAMDVDRTLAALSPGQRALLVLRDLEGVPETSLAAYLDVPQGTVKSRVHRARAAFRRRWVR